ncbi:hypothetical protein NEMBOFW57_009505 [Staphylotrichum longicolle]|uniref:Uncharacterized protein n=1 Tax=Staphylotrichum longicolle TaxID=669026 RepID=A0AAD4EPI6_9PEZI|nr:hypothetical protein NEMBOFW57_009505 [Staphylotrichum longicolle]
MAPGRSLFKVLGVSAGRPWRSASVITARKPKPADPGRRSLCDLPEEIIMLIIQHVQDISPGTVVVLASVSSLIYTKARYVQHRHVAISLKLSKAKNEIAFLKYLSSNGLLPAIRSLRFVELADTKQKGYQFPTPLYGLIDQMTGLLDIHVDAFCYPVPASLLENLKRRTRREGCLRFEPCVEYCGLGLVGDERLPPFEELVLLEYPWGRSSGFPWGVKGYPGKKDEIEQDYWASHCDWSHLRRLVEPKGSLAHRIAQQLTALHEVDLCSAYQFPTIYKHDERAMIHFLETIPSMLDSITVPNFASLSTTPIIRHGSRLRSLELVCPVPYCSRQPEYRWTDGIAGIQALTELRDGLPRLEHLSIHLAADGNDWPYPTLDIVAGFPRLRSVKFNTALAVPRSDVDAPAPPHVTAASAESLLRYMRERSTTEPPSLQRLHLVSDNGWSDEGGLSPARANATGIVCQVSHDDRGWTVTCTKLSEALNEKLRRAVRDGEAPSPADMARIDFKVALEGPISSLVYWDMSKSDPRPRGPWDP